MRPLSSPVVEQSPWRRENIMCAVKPHKAWNEWKGVKAIDLACLADCGRDEPCAEQRLPFDLWNLREGS